MHPNEVKRLNLTHALDLLIELDNLLFEYGSGFRGKTDTLKEMSNEFKKQGLLGRYDYINKMIDDAKEVFRENERLKEIEEDYKQLTKVLNRVMIDYIKSEKSTKEEKELAGFVNDCVVDGNKTIN
jgi:hypothetical protein